MSDHAQQGRELAEYVLKVGIERGAVAITAALAEADQEGFAEARRRMGAASATSSA